METITKTLSEAFYSPAIDDTAFKPMMDLMEHDKKAKHKKPLFSLLKGIGSSVFNIEVNLTQIKKAFQYYNGLNQ